MSDSRSASADRLDATPVIFLESRRALDLARGHGLPDSARVACLSPGLARDCPLPVRVLDASLSGAGMRRFMDEMSAFGASLSRAIEATPELPLAATIVARHSVDFFAQILLKAAMLEDADFLEPRAVVLEQVDPEKGDITSGTVWPTLLASNPKLTIVRSDVAPRQPGSAVGGFLDRLRFSPRSRLFGMLRRASRFLPRRLSRGTLLIITENQLLLETALDLALRGFRLEFEPAGVVPATDSRSVDTSGILETACSLFEPLAARWLCGAAQPVVRQLYRDDLAQALQFELAVREAWSRRLDDTAGRRRPDAILLNFPKGSFGPGMLMAAREHGVPVFSFRHGVTHEIGAFAHTDRAIQETGASDHVFCFNKAAAEVLNSIPNAVGRAHPVGMPREYFDTGSYRKPRPDAPPIAYISTNLYCSYRVFPTAALNDVDRMGPEFELIDQVFSRLPHRVFYKTYPAESYVDPDPVERHAEGRSNIRVFGGKLNASYLFADSRVLVTARASSTVGHCLMSGKPVVFIEFPDHLPLKEEARPLFEAGLFFFDYADPQMCARLREFLSQPIEAIEAGWRQRAEARERLIDRYFSSGRRDAGRRAGRIILEELSRDRALAPGLSAPA